MPRGVEFDARPKDVIETLTECKGVVSLACKKLGIHSTCFYQYIRQYPEVRIALKNIRYAVDEDLLDLAEDTIQWAMAKRKEFPRVGLSAARYVLDNKGHSRNWAGDKSSAEDNLRDDLMDIHEQVEALYDSNDEYRDDQD